MDMIGSFPVQLAADDCMDAGGRAMHGAIAEAFWKTGPEQQRRDLFY